MPSLPDSVAPARSVLEAAGDRSASIAANRALLERFEAVAERMLTNGDAEDAVAATAVAANAMGLHHPGVLGSARLEAVLAEAAARHLAPLPARARPARPERVLHVATELYGVGGHTRALWRWIGRDPASTHDLVLTEQNVNVPAALIDAVQGSGGRVVRLDPAMPRLERAAALRALAGEADVAVLYSHYRDPVPVLAFSAAGDRPPTITFNHADHMFWLGYSITDVLHCCRPCPANALRGLPEERVLVTPFAVTGPDGHAAAPATVDRDSARTDLLARLGWPADALVVLTVGHAHKYSGPRGATLLDMVGDVLAEAPNACMLAIGPREDGAFADLRERTGGRVRALGPAAGIGSVYAAADLYIESWPFGGQTASAEAATHGLPVLSYAPSELEASLLCTHPMYGANLVRSPDEYRRTLRELLAHPGRRAELAERSHAAVTASDAEWESSVERAYALAAELGPVTADELSEPAEGDRDLHTLTDVIQETIAAHHAGADPQVAATTLELCARSPAVRELFGGLSDRLSMPQLERRYSAAFAAPNPTPDALRAVIDEFRKLAASGAAEAFRLALRPEDAEAAVPVLEAAIEAGPEVDVDLQLDPDPRRLRPDWSLEVVAPGEAPTEGPSHRCSGGELVPGRISVVIVAFGQRAVSERCLELLERALGDELGSRYELVLVDNGSPDDTADLFAGWAGRATVVSLERNRDFAGGCNAGAAAATGEVLLFLNNDVDVPAGALGELAATILEHGAAAAGPRLLYPGGDIQHAGVVLLRSGGLPIPHHSFHRQAGDLPAARALLDLDLLTGACLAVRRSAFEAAGGFDESYRNGWEDMDLCLKLRANGGRVTYRGDIELVHHEGKTRGDVHGTDDNAQLFYGRWLAQVDDDGDLLARAFDSVQQPDAPVAERELPAGAVVVGGHASGPSPGADEARALLAALEAAGLAPALAEPAMPFVRASLAQDELDVLDRAARRALTREALLVEVVDGRRLAPASQGVARLATLPAAGLGAAQSVWASSPAAVDEIVAAGMHPERVALLPPPIDGVELGPGGDGLLVALPAHDRALVEALLEAIAPLVAAVAVRLVPNVRPDWLEARVAERLPAATLLPTCASERRFAELAATADAVVCCDPDEPHGRRALVAAAAGAVPVALGSAPAGYVLGDRAVAVEEPTPAALRAAAEHALSIAGERGALAAAVDGECGIATTGARLRELVSAAQMARGAAAPRGAGVR